MTSVTNRQINTHTASPMGLRVLWTRMRFDPSPGCPHPCDERLFFPKVLFRFITVGGTANITNYFTVTMVVGRDNSKSKANHSLSHPIRKASSPSSPSRPLTPIAAFSHFLPRQKTGRQARVKTGTRSLSKSLAMLPTIFVGMVMFNFRARQDSQDPRLFLFRFRSK